MHNMHKRFHKGLGDKTVKLQTHIPWQMYNALVIEKKWLSKLQKITKMIKTTYNFIMSNFYTEEDQPIVKIKELTVSRDVMITQPKRMQTILSTQGKRQSPLWLVSKLLLNEH